MRTVTRLAPGSRRDAAAHRVGQGAEADVDHAGDDHGHGEDHDHTHDAPEGSAAATPGHDADTDPDAAVDTSAGQGASAGDTPTERVPVVEPAEPGEPTVADRIMGRDPQSRE